MVAAQLLKLFDEAFFPAKHKGRIETPSDIPLSPSDVQVELKYDGYRGLLCKDGSHYYMYSKNGKVLNGNFKNIIKLLKPYLDQGWCFDGEVVGLNDNGEIDWRTSARAAKNPRFPADKVVFIIFDCFNKNDLRKSPEGEYWFEMPLKDRRAFLLSVVRHLRSPQIRVSKRFKIRTRNDILKLLERVMQKRGEGIMIKDKLAYYPVSQITNQPLSMWKMKVAYWYTFPIVNVHPGKRGYRRKFGSVEVLLPDGSTEKIGTGIDNEGADLLWLKRKSIIGGQADILWYGQPVDEKHLLRSPVVLLRVIDKKGKEIWRNERYSDYISLAKRWSS